MVFIAWGNLFDRIRTTCSGDRTRKCDSIPNWIHLMYKPRLKENSKKQALWQFKSYQIEVLWNTGNRNTGLQGTFRGTLSLQIKSDLKEPRWLLTSIPQKPIAAFNHPNPMWASDSTRQSVTGINLRKDLSPEANRFSLHSRCFLLFVSLRQDSDQYSCS